MNAAQHKVINLLKILFLYLMCGPRQFFFQCGPEMPKVGHPRFRTFMALNLHASLPKSTFILLLTNALRYRDQIM